MSNSAMFLISWVPLTLNKSPKLEKAVNQTVYWSGGPECKRLPNTCTATNRVEIEDVMRRFRGMRAHRSIAKSKLNRAEYKSIMM